MARKVFYSFHYVGDAWRAAQIRQIGAIEGNQPARDNDWEAVKRGGDAAIEKWIKGQMDNRTCTVVLVGAETANRKWINYEIVESWRRGMGVFGIRIHRLLDQHQKPAAMGANPFEQLRFSDTKNLMSVAIPLHTPAGATSTEVYNSIKNNIDQWIESAIRARG